MAVVNLNKSNANNYQLIFPLLPIDTIYEKSKLFTLNIFGTVIPSLTLDTSIENWQGGKVKSDNGDLTYGEWNFDFVVDSDFSNWSTIYRWIMAIHNGEDDFGWTKQKGKDIDATLLVMNNYRKPVLKIKFHDIWPSVLGEISFNKRDTSDDLISSATFVYDKYIITA